MLINYSGRNAYRSRGDDTVRGGSESYDPDNALLTKVGDLTDLMFFSKS